jgi:hypothetical protein
MRAPGKPTFGQGHAAAELLRQVITVAAAVGGRLSPETSVRLARIGGTIEWAVRRRKRRVLGENLAHALGPSATPAQLRAAVREEIVNEGRRSGDFVAALLRIRSELHRAGGVVSTVRGADRGVFSVAVALEAIS